MPHRNPWLIISREQFLGGWVTRTPDGVIQSHPYERLRDRDDGTVLVRNPEYVPDADTEEKTPGPEGETL